MDDMIVIKIKIKIINKPAALKPFTTIDWFSVM